MESKVAFAAGLFCVVFSMFGSSQSVPDDVVYTEVKKMLVNGTTGILRCRFKGLPNGVFWKKGSDPENTPSIISWTYGVKSGPRYEDGSCDIDGNYSLVIRNVRNTDAGRYICRVSNYKGILIYNYTDVTITDVALQTTSAVTLQKGQTATVPCQVNIRPKKVSWVRSINETLVFIDLSYGAIERSGPGYEEGLFNITKEYSLVIYDVTIQHEDNYLCVVTDYDTGNVHQDATMLTVFAYPREPFPVIEECLVNSSSSCTLRISSDTTITCHVDEYYPDMDLYFVRGSERVQSLETKIWNNSDGTKNKLIRITADGGTDKSFDCVATGTGFVGQAFSKSMTIHLIRDVHQSTVAVAVAVPVILLSTIIVIAIYFIKRRKRHLSQKYAKVPMLYTAKQRDLISYIELWTLVKYARKDNVSGKLGHVLDKLFIDKCTPKTLRTDGDYYNEFCRWKAGYIGTCQREDFFDVCRNAGLKSAIDKLQKYSDSPRAVAVDDLEHTLWHIAESDSVIGLLEDLGALPEYLKVLKGKENRQVMERAMNILKQWRDVNSSGNQEVMLSLALETIKYIPSDRDFFRITDGQKRGLDNNEIQEFLSHLTTSRHCSELTKALNEFKEKHHLVIKLWGSKTRDVWIDNIIEENSTALFDSHQMIQDWWAEQNCSNYEKRCRLERAANVRKGRTDAMDVPEESDERWPTDKMFKHIAKLVAQPRMKQLCDAPQIPHTSEDQTDDEEKRFEAMCRWRDEITKLNKEEKSKVLSTALKSIGFDGLLSRPKRRIIYKAELVDMALDLIMEYFRPLAYSLGINRTKLTSYRQVFCASHLDCGTIRLVLQLCKMIETISVGNMRPDVCSILDKAGYPNVSKRFISASEPSYGELFAIETSVIQDLIPKDGAGTSESSGESKQAKKSTTETVQVIQSHSKINDGDKAEELHTGHQDTPRSDATLTSINVDETQNNDGAWVIINTQDWRVPGTDEYRQRVSNLQRMLELTDEDIPDSNMASVLTLLKIWKERVRPGVIDHRVVLAEGLQKINKTHLVAAVINGQYQNRGTSIAFIEDMLDGMDGSRRTSLERLLKSKEQWIKWLQSSDMTSQWICDWVAEWTKEMESSTMNELIEYVSLTKSSKRHRDFNDKLVEQGFLDLAREIMNIEQVL